MIDGRTHDLPIRARTPAGPWLVLLGCWACGCQPSTEDGLDDAGMGEHAPVQGQCDLGALEDGDPFVDCVEAFEPAEGTSFGHDQLPAIVLGPPRGGGETMGGTDVVSLGCGGSITVAFGAPWPVDGPGPDLIVFENAFVAGSTTFVEPAEVLLSEDGRRWYGFGCAPTGEADASDGEALSGCAGLGPVHATDAATALDPATAGGDAFDLADLGLSQARYLRIVDRTLEHYDSDTWCLGASGGFDLDAIAVLEAGP